VSFRENIGVVSLTITRWPFQHAEACRQGRTFTPPGGTSPAQREQDWLGRLELGPLARLEVAPP
jgi:hypothetical protein